MNFLLKQKFDNANLLFVLTFPLKMGKVLVIILQNESDLISNNIYIVNGIVNLQKVFPIQQILLQVTQMFLFLFLNFD